MRFAGMVIKNLRVRWVKMLFLLLGMGVGVATTVVLSVLTETMREQVRTQFEETGAKLVVAPYAETLSLAYNGVTVASAVSYQTRELSSETLEAIESLPLKSGILVVAPKLLAVEQIGGRRYLVAGVDFPSEGKLNRHWQVEGRVPAGAGEVLLGHAAAGRLHKGVGDTLRIRGTGLRVAGVLTETGAQEDQLVFMDLRQAQTIFGRPGAVSFVELTVARPVLTQVLAQLKARLPGTRVTAVKDQNEARREVADRFARFSLLISLVVMGAGILITGTTMMSSVNERTREIGIFRAIGFRRSHIMRIILAEAALVSAAGGVLGYVAGMTVASLVAPLMVQTGVRIPWHPLWGLGVVALSVLVGLGASLYPAIRAACLNPTEALRSI